MCNDQQDAALDQMAERKPIERKHLERLEHDERHRQDQQHQVRR